MSTVRHNLILLILLPGAQLAGRKGEENRAGRDRSCATRKVRPPAQHCLGGHFYIVRSH